MRTEEKELVARLRFLRQALQPALDIALRRAEVPRRVRFIDHNHDVLLAVPIVVCRPKSVLSPSNIVEGRGDALSSTRLIFSTSLCVRRDTSAASASSSSLTPTSTALRRPVPARKSTAGLGGALLSAPPLEAEPVLDVELALAMRAAVRRGRTILGAPVGMVWYLRLGRW